MFRFDFPGIDPDQSSRSRFKALFFILLLFCVIFWADYITIERYSFYLFYFVPIVLAAWFMNAAGSYLMVVLCEAAWVAAAMKADAGTSTNVIVWNSVIRLISFTFIAFVMNSLRSKQWQMMYLQRQLEHMLQVEKNLAREDLLTGALNSRAFQEALTMERSRAKRYKHGMSLLYIDLDHFKEMNDLHGHEFGDELLKRIASKAQKCLREVDLFARLGGDEFVTLLPETDLKGAEACAQKIMKALAEDLSCGVTLSVGVVAFNNIPASNAETIRAADEAMYQAKKSGKNRYVSKSI